MAERLTPGVYIEEKSGGVRPIQGASTSTAGFLGEAERGIPGRPVFVRNFGDYNLRFGGHRRGTPGHLAAAVEAFFAAGGRRAYVLRVLPGDATAGSSVDVEARGPTSVPAEPHAVVTEVPNEYGPAGDTPFRHSEESGR